MIKILIRNPGLYDSIGKRRFLRNVCTFDLERFDELCEPEAIDWCLSRLLTKNEIAKTTTTNRFENIDLALLPHIDERESLVIHDVAVSTGITSVELFNRIRGRKQGGNIRFLVSDKYAKYSFHRAFPVRWVVDSDGVPVIAYFLVFSAERHATRVFFLSRLLFKLFTKVFWPSATQTETHASVYLFDAALKRLIEEEQVLLEEFDVFNVAVKLKYNVVRVMNLLHSGYFVRDEILRGIAGIHNSLRDNGILVIGRTLESSNSNDASIFRKTEQGFSLLEVIGGGFEEGRINIEKVAVGAT